MPVYVTRAHVTIGDSSRRSHSKNSGPVKRPFYFKDTCKTPYCCRTLLVIFSGLVLVGGGTIMTIIGYKPAIILPWYVSVDNATRNETNTDPTSVPKVLGEPGPLRVMVYIGPILMGIGFFSVMMAIVLFCEIKDRYLMNILPAKGHENRIKKDLLYDIIIEEFRKNYFRGIEVPLKKPERRKSKRFSFSLSGSGNSLISFARRHSHDFYAWAKRKQKGIYGSKKGDDKWKNSTFPKRVTNDSWMKTSSLPNIKHKSELVELADIVSENQNRAQNSYSAVFPKFHQQVVEKLKKIEVSGVDNPAYRDSPFDKKNKAITQKVGIDHVKDNVSLTTVLVHRDSQHNEDAQNHIITPTRDVINIIDPDDVCIKENNDINGSSNSMVELNKDIEQLSETEDQIQTIPNSDSNTQSNIDQNNDDISDQKNALQSCTCKTEEHCAEHALGMASDASSLTLSWEGVPCEWRDARRNTEPCNLFHSRLQDHANSSSSSARSLTFDDAYHKAVQESKSTTNNSEKETEILLENKRTLGPFKTCIRIFHSESNLSKPYSLLRQYQDDTLSLDSLELTDEMLKNFEMAEMAYI